MITSTLVKYSGTQAAGPSGTAGQDRMAEEFTRRCYGGRGGAGVRTRYGQALAVPAGRIHRAGPETPGVRNGYMDGAIRSGRRAAGILASTS